MITIVCFVWMGCSNLMGEKILFDFETDEEMDRFHWKCHTLFTLSDEHVTHGSKSLRLEFYPSEYPGLAPIIKNADWSKYRAFLFDVNNPQDWDILVSIRIDDKKDHPNYADRYNSSFIIMPGTNTITIPFDSLITSGTKRMLNLKMIYRVLVFMEQPKEKATLYFDYIRLAP